MTKLFARAFFALALTFSITACQNDTGVDLETPEAVESDASDLGTEIEADVNDAADATDAAVEEAGDDIDAAATEAADDIDAAADEVDAEIDNEVQ